MSKRRMFWASFAALGFLVAGCAGSDDEVTSQGSDSSEQAASSSSSSVPATTESSDQSDASAAGGSDVTGEENEPTDDESSNSGAVDTGDSDTEGAVSETDERANGTFRTESDNILCRQFADSVECVIAEYSYDATADKPEGCDNDWESFLSVTSENEPASFSCVSDAAFYTTADGGLLVDDDFPVLKYGEELELGDFSCVVDIATGVKCTNQSENGFIVSKASYEFF